MKKSNDYLNQKIILIRKNIKSDKDRVFYFVRLDKGESSTNLFECKASIENHEENMNNCEKKIKSKPIIL